MADGMMRHDDDGHDGPESRHGECGSGGDDTDTLQQTAREELARAAEDLERLTSELHERTALVERLETLADALLDIVPAPAIVVDPEGRIAAVSRSGATEIPELATGLGKQVSSVVPKPVANEVAAFMAGSSATPAQTALLAETSSRFVPLHGGWLLVVFQT